MNELMDELTIGEVAQQSGLNTSTIRYYEQVGILPAPRRCNGRRRYQAGVLGRLELIQFAKYAGFTLAEIETLLHGFDTDMKPSTRWRALAEEKLPEVEQLIRQAQKMKQVLQEGLDCDCVRFNECVIEQDEGCIAGRE